MTKSFSPFHPLLLPWHRSRGDVFFCMFNDICLFCSEVSKGSSITTQKNQWRRSDFFTQCIHSGYQLERSRFKIILVVRKKEKNWTRKKKKLNSWIFVHFLLFQVWCFSCLFTVLMMTTKSKAVKVNFLDSLSHLRVGTRTFFGAIKLLVATYILNKISKKK